MSLIETWRMESYRSFKQKMERQNIKGLGMGGTDLEQAAIKDRKWKRDNQLVKR